jgi:hypothetical protein
MMKKDSKTNNTEINKKLYLDRLEELRNSPRITFGKALLSLKENDGFKTLMEEEFFKAYPLRIIRLKADPSIALSDMGDKQIKTFDKILDAGGVLQMFFLQIEAEYNQVLNEISKIEIELKGK